MIVECIFSRFPICNQSSSAYENFCNIENETELHSFKILGTFLDVKKQDTSMKISKKAIVFCTICKEIDFFSPYFSVGMLFEIAFITNYVLRF